MASNKPQIHNFISNQERWFVFLKEKRTFWQPFYSLCLRGSEFGGDGGGGRVTVVGRSSGSSMGRTRRVPLIATSCSTEESSWSNPSSNSPTPVLVAEERLRLTVQEPVSSVLTVTSAYKELTLVSFRIKSESSSWS